MAKAEIHSLPLFVTSTASDVSTGVVRILNGTVKSVTVAMYAIDDVGTRSGPATFTLNASAAVEFNSMDLVTGNSMEGLIGGIGSRHMLGHCRTAAGSCPGSWSSIEADRFRRRATRASLSARA